MKALSSALTATETEAEDVSRTVARSNLFKTAVFGNDPNWGRVLSAVGTTDAQFDPDRIDVTINGVTVCRNGAIGDPREGVDLAASRAVVVSVSTSMLRVSKEARHRITRNSAASKLA